MSAQDRLADLARTAGAERAAVFRSRAGLLGADPPLAFGAAPEDPEDLLEELGRASALSAPTVEQLAQALEQALAAPRRREGSRGNVLRLSLGRSVAELVLFRGDGPSRAGLGPALAALENEALAWGPPPQMESACSLVALDDRTSLLMARDGELLSLSGPMRRALGAEVPAGSFVAPPRRRLFLAQVRDLARLSGDGIREEARGLAAPGEVTIERHGELALATLRGPADLQARLQSMAATELTPRELSCGVELTAGKSYRQIAAALQLSPDTVKLHLRAVYQKLGVTGREQFVALMAGLLLPSRRPAP